MARIQCPSTTHKFTYFILPLIGIPSTVLYVISLLSIKILDGKRRQRCHHWIKNNSKVKNNVCYWNRFASSTYISFCFFLLSAIFVKALKKKPSKVTDSHQRLFYSSDVFYYCEHTHTCYEICSFSFCFTRQTSSFCRFLMQIFWTKNK